MPTILAIAALTGIATLSPQASMALTISPEVKLKLERTNPPGAKPFVDEFELHITYDLDSFMSTSGVTPLRYPQLNNQAVAPMTSKAIRFIQ
jgi:hypothetical protein